MNKHNTVFIFSSSDEVEKLLRVTICKDGELEIINRSMELEIVNLKTVIDRMPGSLNNHSVYEEAKTKLDHTNREKIELLKKTSQMKVVINELHESINMINIKNEEKVRNVSQISETRLASFLTLKEQEISALKKRPHLIQDRLIEVENPVLKRVLENKANEIGRLRIELENLLKRSPQKNEKIIYKEDPDLANKFRQKLNEVRGLQNKVKNEMNKQPKLIERIVNVEDSGLKNEVEG